MSPISCKRHRPEVIRYDTQPHLIHPPPLPGRGTSDVGGGDRGS